MELYRHIHGLPGCKGLKYLRSILEAGQPPIDVNEASIQQLQEREKIVFYAADARAALTPTAVQEILCCGCDRCKAVRNTTGTENKARVEAVFSHQCTLLLAILIYLVRSDLIHVFVRQGVTDATIADVPNILEDKEADFQKLFDSQSVKSFCDKFTQARGLFQPVKFTLDELSYEYQRERRFPFLNDKFHAAGSFGEVWRFDIHPDFLSDGIKQAKWYRDQGNVSIHQVPLYQA